VGLPGQAGAGSRRFLPPDVVQPVGYGDDEAMLPVTQRGLAGTRLMQEYFAFPQRFLFFDVERLASAWAACPGNECELVLLFKRPAEGLEGAVDASNFALHCVPAINLFERRADRIAVDDSSFEFHVVPERSAPGDFEVHSILDVEGVTQANETLRFHPLFASPHAAPSGHKAYWSALRQPKLPSEKTRREGPRSGYVSSDVFLSLVDGREAPFPDDLRQLALKVMATNCDLPVFMPGTGLSLSVAAPVESVQVQAGPSRPLSSMREVNAAWQLLNLLALNHLSLLDTDEEQGAQALRELLSLFVMVSDPATRRQIDGLLKVSTRAVVRRHPLPGPLAFGRGVEVRLQVDEHAFEGASAFLLGSVLHHYFARHAALNNFVQTSLVSLSRGELMRWQPRLGARGLL
jgi:type VI secretion system protein ImpG